MVWILSIIVPQRNVVQFFSYASCFGRVSMFSLSSYCVGRLLAQQQKKTLNWCVFFMIWPFVYQTDSLSLVCLYELYFSKISHQAVRLSRSFVPNTSESLGPHSLTLIRLVRPHPQSQTPPPTQPPLPTQPPPPSKHVLQPGLLCRFTQTKIAAAWRTIWSTLAQALWFINCFSGHKSLL